MALVIGIAVLTILLAAVGPLIATVMKREREAELRFRGRQYARAISLFQRRFGRYPNSLKEMYENRPRTIRKLWQDPMCRCDDWHLLPPGAIPIRDVPRGQQTGLQPPRPTPTPGPFAAPPEGGVGPIGGVRSKVHQEALGEWKGRKYYDEWDFIAGQAEDDGRKRVIPPGGYRHPPPPTRRPA
ncbi:MAG: hypothetical protein ACRD3M_12225 [Thermoanaerobaculia bacterium]